MPMKNLFVLIAALFSFVNADPQQKELSLKDAVIEQYGKFYPERIQGFQWIPGENDSSYLENPTNLKIESADGKKAAITLSISEVNQTLGSDLKRFSGMTWKDSNSFYLVNGTTYYLYDYKLKQGKKLSEIDSLAQNKTLQKETGNVAYTIDNNLYIKTAAGKTIAVTKNDDKNIVSGQAIARSEFGITNGIFWSPTGNLLAFYQKDESDVADYPLLNIIPTPGE